MKMRRLTGIVASFFILVSAAAEPPSPGPVANLSIEAFAEEPLIISPRLSPDGNSYAVSMSSHGTSVLAILPVRPGTGKPVSVAIGEKNELGNWAWVNNEWLIATLNTTVSYEAQDIRVSRAFGVSARDGHYVPIARDKAGQDGADILWIARDGTPRVLIAIQQSLYSNQEQFYPEVFEVNVSNGNMSSRAKPQNGVLDWYADGEGNVRIGIGYSDQQQTSKLLYRERNGDAFRIVEKARGKANENLTVPALFLAAPGKALAYSENASGFDALYELDLKTLTLGKEVFSAPGYDIDELRADPSRSQLIGVTYADTRTHTEWLDPIMSKVQSDMDKFAGPASRASIVSASRDQTRFIVHVGSAETPGLYYLLDIERRVMDLIGPVNSKLGRAALAPVTSLRYKARDGLEIEAFLTLPQGREPKGLPLIVMPHGGPAARDELEWDWWSQYLAHLGYAVIKPNYRGSTGYGAEFEGKSDGEWGLAMQDDLIDAIDHLAAAGTVDPKRVCIVGASYGGYAALRAAQRDSARYRCAVSYAGVADIGGMLKYDSRFINSSSRRDYRRKGAPDYQKVSPINFAEQFAIPVLLMHGRRDLTVPVRQSQAMYAKLMKAGKQARYVEQPLADHHFSRYEDRLQFLQELTTFLQAHNPAN
jgi:dipeptidyl aminopeptidase/acylaminoacyl peptidase